MQVLPVGSMHSLVLLHRASLLLKPLAHSPWLCVCQVHQGSRALERGAPGAYGAPGRCWAAHFQIRQRGTAGIAMHWAAVAAAATRVC